MYFIIVNIEGVIIVRRRFYIYVILILVNVVFLKYWRVWLGFFSFLFDGNIFVIIKIKVNFDMIDVVKIRLNIKMYVVILCGRK